MSEEDASITGKSRNAGEANLSPAEIEVLIAKLAMSQLQASAALSNIIEILANSGIGSAEGLQEALINIRSSRDNAFFAGKRIFGER